MSKNKVFQSNFDHFLILKTISVAYLIYYLAYHHQLKWAIPEKKTNRGGGAAEDMEFPGVSNKQHSEFPGVNQKRSECNLQGLPRKDHVEFPAERVLVFGLRKDVIQQTDSRLRKASRLNRATNCAGNLGESKKYTVLAQINGIINKDNTISRDLMSFYTSTILDIRLFIIFFQPYDVVFTFR